MARSKRKSVVLTDEDITLIIKVFKEMSVSALVCRSGVVEKLERSRKRISVSSAKGKGRGLQDKVARDIAGLLGVEFSKSDDEALVSSRQMGQHGTDIILRGRAASRFPYSVEAKSTEVLRLTAAWEQAVENSGDGKETLLVYKHKGIDEPLAIVRWGWFLELHRRLGV